MIANSYSGDISEGVVRWIQRVMPTWALGLGAIVGFGAFTSGVGPVAAIAVFFAAATTSAIAAVTGVLKGYFAIVTIRHVLRWRVGEVELLEPLKHLRLFEDIGGEQTETTLYDKVVDLLNKFVQEHPKGVDASIVEFATYLKQNGITDDEFKEIDKVIGPSIKDQFIKAIQDHPEALEQLKK